MKLRFVEFADKYGLPYMHVRDAVTYSTPGRKPYYDTAYEESVIREKLVDFYQRKIDRAERKLTDLRKMQARARGGA